MNSVLILGRQPALGLAELESLYGDESVEPLGSQAALVKVDPCLLAFDRLGASTKFCKHLTTLPTTDWQEIEDFLLKVAPGHSQQMPEGKMTLGLSAIDMRVSPKKLLALGLSVKKAIKQTGRNVRLIPNKSTELNAAQILHNKLTSPTGWELVFIRNGNQTEIVQTVKVQDIDDYTRRDRQRPKRDAFVGMLPPKLAQLIINLATGPVPEAKLQNICDIPADQPIPPTILNQTILDPFCGTGVLLQESLLMGYNAYGTDLEQRMVDYSQANLDWLADIYQVDGTRFTLEQGDATDHNWQQSFDFVACETYLGRPFTSTPPRDVLAKVMRDVDTIHEKFFKNLAKQTKPGTRLCIALPAWSIPTHRSSLPPRKASRTARASGARDGFSAPLLNRSSISTTSSATRRENHSGTQMRGDGFVHLPVLDHLEKLGYTRISFAHAGDDDLIYHREGQIVGRELVVLKRT